MTRRLRAVALGLFVLFAASSVTRTSFGQGIRPAASVATKAAQKSVRDLAPATAESVGMSAERLSRLDVAMKRLVDEKQVAGLVTLVERHGKIVDYNAWGQL